MKEPSHQRGTGPAQQAGNIFKARMCQDSIALRKEFKNGLDLCGAPEANGLKELLEARDGHTPIVALTAKKGDRDMCLAGMNHCISKSILQKKRQPILSQFSVSTSVEV